MPHRVIIDGEPDTYQSILKEHGPVTFPSFKGERVYMLPFYKSVPLPSHLGRWQLTVDAMLAQIETKERLFLMVDESWITAGASHRRPKPHIDGNWVEEIPGTFGFKATRALYDETLLLASSVVGCVGWRGMWSGEIGQGGDLSHLNLDGLERVTFKPFTTYAGNVTMIHESIPISTDCQRTLVRINVPNHIL